MSELKVYRNDVTEWVIATSPEDADKIIAETGQTFGPNDDPNEWEECPLGNSWTCQESEDQTDLVTMTFRDWIAKKGRGYLGTTEY